MRLLNTISLTFEEFSDDKIMPYAILSHRWEEEEVLYQDMLTGRARKLKGYAKLEGCCRLARSEGFKYVWIDTCCIDKSSSAELTEAINSMFLWYQRADECYAYLSDVRSSSLSSAAAQEEFSSSVWFTRGWTLQELIAPSKVLFYNRSWRYLGPKNKLRYLIEVVTSIDPDVLTGKTSLFECPIAQRMAWAAERTTTRVEDRAYSLLGIFRVSMPMLYGEGERAFQRLQEEIIKQSDDHSLFAWRDKKSAKSPLAPSPSCFAGLDELVRIVPTNDTSQGFSMKNAGLSIELQLIPWAMNTYLAPLRCGYISASGSDISALSQRGYDRACIFLQQTDHENQFIRVSVNGKDLVALNGDRVADLRDRFGYPTRPIFMHQVSMESYVQPADTSFYGFVFSFRHDSLFVKGRLPKTRDVICGHEWDPKRPVFEIESGRQYVAGMFRIYTNHYMYFGFDRDFSPVCLITKHTPHSIEPKFQEPGAQPLNKVHALQLLNIQWLQRQIEKGAGSDRTVLAVKGDRKLRTEVECGSLSLHIVFEDRYSEITKMRGWHVDLNRLEHPKSPGRAQGIRENPPRINVVDHDAGANVRVMKDIPDDYRPFRPKDVAASPRPAGNRDRSGSRGNEHVKVDNDVRVISSPKLVSGFVARGKSPAGDRIIKEEIPLRPGGQAIAEQAASRTPSPRRRKAFIDPNTIGQR